MPATMITSRVPFESTLCDAATVALDGRGDCRVAVSILGTGMFNKGE
jgi:hypothetical protein